MSENLSDAKGGLISVENANSLINNFLSNHYSATTYGTVNVKSFIFEADLIRSYLNNSSIVDVKFMLGTKTINNVDYPTIIIAGYDSNGNYVKTGSNNNEVLDNCNLCPPTCPVSGSAANDTIS